MRLETYDNRRALFTGLAGWVAIELVEALAHGPASLALPGGEHVDGVFEELARINLDWEQVTVMPGDERWVPENHARSNAGMIGRHLLRGHAAKATLLSLYTGDATPEAAEHKLARLVRLHLPLTVVMLGMGEDGHVASLFPRSPRLALALSDEAEAVMGMQAPDGECRMSLTLPALRGARSRHLMIVGETKRRILEEAAGRDPMDAPVAAILDGTTVHWAA